MNNQNKQFCLGTKKTQVIFFKPAEPASWTLYTPMLLGLTIFLNNVTKNLISQLWIYFLYLLYFIKNCAVLLNEQPAFLTHSFTRTLPCLVLIHKTQGNLYRIREIRDTKSPNSVVFYSHFKWRPHSTEKYFSLLFSVVFFFIFDIFAKILHGSERDNR